MRKEKLLRKLTGIMAIAIIALVTAFTATSCTPKKSAEQLALEARVAELEAAQEAEIQAQIEAVASGRSGRRGGGRRGQQAEETLLPPSEDAPFDEKAGWLEAELAKYADRTAAMDDIWPLLDMLRMLEVDAEPEVREMRGLPLVELTPAQIARYNALSAEYSRVATAAYSAAEPQTPQVAVTPQQPQTSQVVAPQVPTTPGPTPPQTPQVVTPPPQTPQTPQTGTRTTTAGTPTTQPQIPATQTPQTPQTGTGTATPQPQTPQTPAGGTQPRTSGVAHAPPVLDESMYSHNISQGAVQITKYNGNATSVRIPQTINGQPVRYISGGAFAGSRITSVIIPSSITQISQDAFANCKSLASFTYEGGISGHLNNLQGMGDLHDKIYMIDRRNGTPGTYTTTAPMGIDSVWTRPDQTPILSVVTQQGTTGEGVSWICINDSTVAIIGGPRRHSGEQ